MRCRFQSKLKQKLRLSLSVTFVTNACIVCDVIRCQVQKVVFRCNFYDVRVYYRCNTKKGM